MSRTYTVRKNAATQVAPQAAEVAIAPNGTPALPQPNVLAAALAAQVPPVAPAKESKAQYVGPMLALRGASKHYVRAPGSGQLVCGDALAQVLAPLTVEEVILVCQQSLALESNPYAHLNIGQQSMNMRNKLRGAFKRGELKVEDVAGVRDAILA